jgi:hypothetical protein
MFGEFTCNCLKMQENKGFWGDWFKLNADNMVKIRSFKVCSVRANNIVIMEG